MAFLKVLAAIELVGLVLSVALCLGGAATESGEAMPIMTLLGLVGVVVFGVAGVLLVVVAVLVAL